LSAQYLVKLLIDKKENFSVAGTSRSKIKFKEKEVKSFYLEEEKFDLKITEYLKDVTHVLVSTPPKIEDVIIKNFYDILSLNKKLTWLGYLSSTSVYGNHDGEWVTENSNTNPTSDAGINRLHAEKKFLQTNLPVRIFRLSGIYSKERNVLDRLKHQEIRVVQMKNQIFSRIHVEDIAQTLWNSFQKSKVKDIFNVSDDMPCSYKEVVEYASKLLGLEKPKEVSFKDLPEGSMKNFYLDSKKVSNQKAKLMGLQLKYPTYKEGLDSIFNQFNQFSSYFFKILLTTKTVISIFL
jgi:nucleoside-diphosphate-sugar epimerase